MVKWSFKPIHSTHWVIKSETIFGQQPNTVLQAALLNNGDLLLEPRSN